MKTVSFYNINELEPSAHSIRKLFKEPETGHLLTIQEENPCYAGRSGFSNYISLNGVTYVVTGLIYVIDESKVIVTVHRAPQ